jgi:hypothetical protein
MRCRRHDGRNSCGSRKHEVLEFGGAPTGPAAAYPPKLCSFLRDKFLAAVALQHTSVTAREQVRLATSGRVHRHVFRGSTEEGQKDVKRREDDASMAGMRNPASVCRGWPQLVEGMVPLRDLFISWQRKHPCFQGMSGACGPTPSRDPPSPAEVASLRAAVGKSLGISPNLVESHHPASPWRYSLVQALQVRTGDTDAPLGQWLQHGAPMGLSRPIETGGLFPARGTDPELDLDELAALVPVSSNHPSFIDLHDEDVAPGIKLLEQQLDAGFGLLFTDKAAAEAYLGVQTHPAPLGNIAKLKPDGTWKHRLIQDLRRNAVNSAVTLTERQVLPRPVDHARDLGLLSEDLRRGESMSVFILDFADAFMSIPLHAEERCYNCASVDNTLSRGRAALFKGEVPTGKFMVWRVLGFGGKPNPLVFSRAASFAMRTAQALVGVPNRRLQCPLLARSRGQLCVDDPIWGLAGTQTVDIILMYWLAIGIPLSWKKGPSMIWRLDVAPTPGLG